MRIIVVGGTGTIGSAVVKSLRERHDIITASTKNGDVKVDIKDHHSIRSLYKTVGEFDAVIATTGRVHFADLSEMTADDYQIGLQNKLMGQVNLVLIGCQYIQDSGSFTLTSGILSHDPIRFGTSASMVNGAIDSFVESAAIEMPRGIRINAVSPTVIEESMQDFGDYFRGFTPVSAERVANAYIKSVEGLQTGQVYCIHD